MPLLVSVLLVQLVHATQLVLEAANNNPLIILATMLDRFNLTKPTAIDAKPVTQDSC